MANGKKKEQHSNPECLKKYTSCFYFVFVYTHFKNILPKLKDQTKSYYTCAKTIFLLGKFKF